MIFSSIIGIIANKKRPDVWADLITCDMIRDNKTSRSLFATS